MKTTRRGFMKASALAGAGLAMAKFAERSAYAFYQSSGLGLTLFSENLRGSDVTSLATEIGVADSDGVATTGALHYTINIDPISDTLHSAMGPTSLWGYAHNVYLIAGPPTPRHLGGIIVAQKGTPIQITFRNRLPATHPIPVDTTIHGANQARNRMAVHLHGGLVPWISDGGPFDWWAPDGTHGLSFLNNQVLKCILR